ncbi:hypothetical protein V2A60_002204 [Cordyceps javanica]
MALKAALAAAILLPANLVSSATVDKRIVGGVAAEEGEIKFIVSIRDETGSHMCGGSLLDSTTVLTAAHCCFSRHKLVSVSAGSVWRDYVAEEAQVASTITHPDYDSGRDEYGMVEGTEHHNDVAILKLATPIEKSSDIDYATLPPAGSDAAVGSNATAAGWGHTLPVTPESTDLAYPYNLLKVVLPIRARKDCAHYQNIGERDTIICAGGSGKNVCSQDSGGPLFDEKTGELLGVVSQGTRDENNEMCNQTPAAFTRVGSYIDFINSHLGP